MASPTPPANGSHIGRIDGWKEIATHVGRGVRTVQRWERELGLPVRRLDTGGAEVVFAYREELDAWVLRQSRVGLAEKPADAEARSDDRGDARTSEPTADPAAAIYTRSSVQARRRLWAGTAVLLLAISAWAWLWRSTPADTPAAPLVSASEPATVESVGGDLVVRDANRRVLWRRPFSVPLREFGSPGQPVEGLTLSTAAAIVDLDGDGHKEVILARNDLGDARVYGFEHDGRERFTHVADRPVQFGTDRCPPIRFNAVFVNAEAGKLPTVWVAGHHTENFPSVIERLDAAGQVRSEYWSNGFIGAFARFEIGGRQQTFVGSNNNETGGAGVAVFSGEVTGSAPAVVPKYVCTGCPPGTPTAFLVFPASRLQREMDDIAEVHRIVRSDQEHLTVEVIVGRAPDPGIPHAIAYYTLDRNLRVIKAELGSGFRTLQRQMEAVHRVTAATRFRDDGDLYPVRRWNGHGYDLINGPEIQSDPTSVPAGVHR